MRRPRRGTRPGRCRRGRADGGQVAVEFLGLIPIVALGFLGAVQLTFAVSAVQATSTAARAAARAASMDGDPRTAARRAVPSWLADDVQVNVSGDLTPRATVSLRIPLVFPGFSGPTVTRTASFEAERGTTPWG